MSAAKNLLLSAALLVSFSSPSYAFLDGVVVGLTSVTNNLIDSTESVTNNTMNNATNTALTLSSNPGKMADRIGLMADRIGYMGDRIVTTEGIMAGLAHKIIDGPNKQPQQAQQQFAWGYAPAPSNQQVSYSNNGYAFNNGYANNRPTQNQNYTVNPYMPGYAAAPAPSFGYAKPDNSRYSASNMIFGQAGSTYTAQRNAPQPLATGYQAAYQPAYQPVSKVSGYGFAQQASFNTSSNNCGYAYGVVRNCR